MQKEALRDFMNENKENVKKNWIVLETNQNGLVRLISKGDTGIVPVGTFLTIETATNKFILRVDKSIQEEIFKPSILLVEADLTLPSSDQKCKNIIFATRVHETSLQSDDSASFIHPGLIARRSTQEEIDEALSLSVDGVPVFLATNLFGTARILKGLNEKLITANIPEDAFYHQMIIAGKTGSGKTTALKYLAQYFIEELDGAVIAVNVKGKDLLYMNRPSKANSEIKKEWECLEKKEHSVLNFSIYVPYKNPPVDLRNIDEKSIRHITLSVDDIVPEVLTSLMRNLSDIAESTLPDIFRYWLEREKKSDDKFGAFVEYFDNLYDRYAPEGLPGINQRANNITYPIARSTHNLIRRELNYISKYFDAPTDSKSLTLQAEDLIQKKCMSILHLTESISFGSILLRDIVKKIKEYMYGDCSIPVLFVIDETHLFYDSKTSKDALEDLSTICRTGRQYKTAIIFASQSPKHIPHDLASVVATKIFFQSEKKEANNFGLSIENIDIETLPKGFCVAKINGQPHLKLLKFPMAFGGVNYE